MNSVNNILVIRNLSVNYPSEGILSKKKFHNALDSVSFEVKEGMTLGVVGESGSGKTTLGKAIVRLLDVFGGYVRISGQIYYKNNINKKIIDINNAGRSELKLIRKEIQLVFQNPILSLNPGFTVRELISEPLKNYYNLKGEALNKEFNEWIKLTGLTNIDADDYPQNLSGGQKQRVALARCLTVKPAILIADEIVSALDISVQGQVLNLLLDLKEKLNLTLLFISHNLALVRNFCDYIIVMKSGKITEKGTPEKIFLSPENEYTKNLIDSIPLKGNIRI